MNEATSKNLANIRKVIRCLVKLASACGFSVDVLLKEVRELYPKEPGLQNSGLINNDVINEDDRDSLGSILSSWRAKAGYVDNEGKPSDIPIRGPAPSLEALFDGENMRSGLKRTFEEAQTILEECGAIELGADGIAHMKSIVFSVNTDKSVGVGVQLAYFGEYASTIDYNSSKKSGEGRFQYSASVQGFPRDSVPMLNKILNEAGFGFVSQIDGVLESTASSADPDAPKLERVSVQTFLHISDDE